MTHELEITGHCYEMKDAVMTKAMLNGKIYNLSLVEKPEQEPFKSKEETEPKSLDFERSDFGIIPPRDINHPDFQSYGEYWKDREKRLGKIIMYAGKLGIRELPLKEILQNPNEDVCTILKKYFPHIKESTLRSYIYKYKQSIQKHFPNAQPKKITRKRRRKPYGKVCFDKSYKKWIDKKELKKVQVAIQKWNFTPTAEAIAKETQLRKNIVHSILHYLLRRNLIYKETVEGTPVYWSVNFTPRV